MFGMREWDDQESLGWGILPHDFLPFHPAHCAGSGWNLVWAVRLPNKVNEC